MYSGQLYSVSEGEEVNWKNVEFIKEKKAFTIERTISVYKLIYFRV